MPFADANVFGVLNSSRGSIPLPRKSGGTSLRQAQSATYLPELQWTLRRQSSNNVLVRPPRNGPTKTSTQVTQQRPKVVQVYALNSPALVMSKTWPGRVCTYMANREGLGDPRGTLV
ncbi:hypothetical protein Landi51_01623 [Colletotrichum acutatum]